MHIAAQIEIVIPESFHEKWTNLLILKGEMYQFINFNIEKWKFF